MYLQSKDKNRGERKTKNSHQLFGLHLFFLCVCCLLPKYKNVATHCQYPQSGWDSQRSHCVTTDLCSSFETDTAEPLPNNPGGPGRRRHTSARKTLVCQQAPLLKRPLLPLNKKKEKKTGLRKEKRRGKALFSVQQQLEDTRQTQKKRGERWQRRPRGSVFMLPRSLLFLFSL